MNQSAHRQSQAKKLLELLLSRKGQRIGLPEIQRLGIAQHGARLKELRALGYVIHNEMETAPDGAKHSWYVLLAEPGELPLFRAAAAANNTAIPSDVSRDEMARMRRLPRG